MVNLLSLLSLHCDKGQIEGKEEREKDTQSFYLMGFYTNLHLEGLGGREKASLF